MTFRRSTLPGCVLALAAGLAASALSAQAVKVGPEFRVNTYTTAPQSQNSVAMDASGNFVVTWTSVNQDGSGFGVFGQRFDAAGTKLGPEFQVNTYTSNAQRNPDVAMTAAGSFVVVWQSGFQDGSSYGIFGQRFDAAGNKQGPEFQVNTYTTGLQGYPFVSMGTAGDFVVAWGSYRSGSAYDIFAQRFDASGNKLGGEIQVNTYTTSNQYPYDIKIGPGGGFVVVWTSLGQDGSNYGAFGQRFDASGSKLGSEFQINTYTFNTQTYPRLGFDAAGNFVVVWESATQDGSNMGVFGQRFNAAGSKIGSEFQVNTVTANAQRNPRLAVAPDGRFVVAWWDFYGDGTLNAGVTAQVYDRTGTKSGPAFSVNTYTTSAQYRPSVAMSPSGQFVVTWDSDQQDGSSIGVFGQRLALPSAFYSLTPCRVLDTRGAPGPYGGPALAAQADRTFVLAGQCGIPAGATGVSINVTVTQPTAAGDLRIFPASTSLPLVSTINYRAGQTRANNAIALLGPGGDLTVHSDQPTGTTHFILDVNGYYQ